MSQRLILCSEVKPRGGAAAKASLNRAKDMYTLKLVECVLRFSSGLADLIEQVRRNSSAILRNLFMKSRQRWAEDEIHKRRFKCVHVRKLYGVDPKPGDLSMTRVKRR